MIKNLNKLKHFFLGLLIIVGLLGCSHPLKNYPEREGGSSLSYTPLHVPQAKLYGCRVAANGQRVCGYDCKEVNGNVRCGMFPGQRCLVGSSGYIACGYDCKKTWREANCGIRYGDRCLIIAATGEVICGLNCHREGGFIRCQASPPYRTEFPSSYSPKTLTNAAPH